MRKYFLSNRSVVVAIFIALLLWSTTTLIPVIDANENKDVIEKYKCIDSIKTREVFNRFYDNLINQDENEKYSEYFAYEDFEEYWDAYVNFTNFITGNTNNKWWLIIVNELFSTWQADNYYDWHKQVNNGIENLWNHFGTLAGISFILSLFLYVFDIGKISPFVWLMCFLGGVEAVAGMGYSWNGVNNFQRLLRREVDIIIHVVNETGVGIPNLHNTQGGILAKNKNAIVRCKEEGDKGVFDSQKFQYKMRPIKGNTSEQGWYSLSNRIEFDEDERSSMLKYKQAVCPPGLWNISIDGGDIYNSTKIEEFNVLTADVVILDNIALYERHPFNQSRKI